jgi:pantoate--beta-alanine ligase
VEIVGMPIVREADGLAMSSRNVYLSADERCQALVLSQSLERARQMVANGVHLVDTVLGELHVLFVAQPDVRIDYLRICHQATLCVQDRIDADSVLLMAASVGKTRLIDNGALIC